VHAPSVLLPGACLRDAFRDPALDAGPVYVGRLVQM